MSDTFSELSKNIAQNFIQSILFVDDKAYNPIQNDHPFDVKRMIKESAGRGIIATAYAPEIQEDLIHIVEVGKKADVIVLDWRMDVNDASSSEQDDEEEDVADHRGDFAIGVIKKIIDYTQAGDSADLLKLIFIYTGEKGLQRICTDLHAELVSFEQLDDFSLLCGGIRISIWAKEILSPSFKHMPENKKRLRSYTQLLDEIPTEYAKVSSGLLSNTCLEALTLLRDNTYKLLANFSPSLDPAFASHRAMLRTPNDAGDLLRETICGELNSILANADISQRVSSATMHEWVLSRDFVDTEITVKNGTQTTAATTITIDAEKRSFWQKNGYLALLTRELDEAGGPLLKKKEIDKCERDQLKKHACESFAPQGDTTAGINEEFSILTHHKRNYLSSEKPPSLTLGSVVKDGERFLLCIQQRCDSVRIADEDRRKFLFLPLKPNEQNFDVLFKNGSQGYTRLSTCDKECHSLEIVKFSPVEGSGIVQAQKEKGVYYFVGGASGDEKFQWILDLKEAHAQRIVNNFAANLARVGLDESEWLRRT